MQVLYFGLYRSVLQYTLYLQAVVVWSGLRLKKYEPASHKFLAETNLEDALLL
jgi:hypothetical protein